VKEALRSGPVAKILVARGVQGDNVDDILSLAKEKKVQFIWVDRKKLDLLTSRGNHQGVAAYIAPLGYVDYRDLITKAVAAPLPGISLIFLDGIQDPHNLGSIIRSAVYFGVQGVVIPKWRSASLTGAVMRSSAGAAGYIGIAQVSNLATILESAKDKGLWLIGADMEGNDVKKADIPKPCALVLGAEGMGLHRLVREKCDYLVGVKGFAKQSGVDSLNVGVATGILLHQLTN